MTPVEHRAAAYGKIGIVFGVRFVFGRQWTGLFLSGAAGFFTYGVAPEGWMFCLGIPIMAFWG